MLLCRFMFPLALATLLLPRTCAFSADKPTPPKVEGLWNSDGYGYFIEIRGDELTRYQVTRRSCILDLKAKKVEAAAPGEVRFLGKTVNSDSGAQDEFSLRAGPTADILIMHLEGAIGDMDLRRAKDRPPHFGQAVANTPQENFEVFWTTFDEHYPLFKLHKCDWAAVRRANLAKIDANTSPEALFKVLQGMIAPLDDAHTSLEAKKLKKDFDGSRKGDDDYKLSRDKKAIRKIIDTKYVQGELRDFCNRKIQYGTLGGGIGYLRINSFENYTKDPRFAGQLAALENALDAIFKDADRLAGLVIDVRVNGGGSDVFGIRIASRLTRVEYLAYTKVARNDPSNHAAFSRPQPIRVSPSDRPGFRGPVVLLTGTDSVSAAETFTQSLMGRTPKITRVGNNTQGVFSDVLERQLPNGWHFGLPNELFLTADGKSFDGPGIPPDVRVPVFAKTDRDAGRDAAIDKALEILRKPRGDKP